jgi:hypothetical protein
MLPTFEVTHFIHQPALRDVAADGVFLLTINNSNINNNYKMYDIKLPDMKEFHDRIR